MCKQQTLRVDGLKYAEKNYVEICHKSGEIREKWNNRRTQGVANENGSGPIFASADNAHGLSELTHFPLSLSLSQSNVEVIYQLGTTIFKGRILQCMLRTVGAAEVHY